MKLNWNQRYLQNPGGTESYFLDEAYRHQRIVRIAEDHFTKWGYLPVTTPVFDFFENYRSLLGYEDERQCYRFTDREGELLMLRSDITLFLARQIGMRLRGSSGPTRVYYAESIMRHQMEQDIYGDELFQSGAELIGLPGIEGDVEIILMLYELLEAMQLPLWRVHLGSREFLRALAGGHESAEIFRLADLRDSRSLCQVFSNLGLGDPSRRVELLFFIGTPEEFSNLCTEVLEADAWSNLRGDESEENRKEASLGLALNNLRKICELLASTRRVDNLRIDLSEHGGSRPYYTGFTLKAYVEGANAAVASGGRYDNLLQAYGYPSPAAGFSLFMRKIEPCAALAAATPGSQKIGTAHGESFESRYQYATERRIRGERVVLSDTRTKGKMNGN